MTVKYLDPYKDYPYGKLRGDKTDTWFKISFSEAKLYAIDNGYILAGQFTQSTFCSLSRRSLSLSIRAIWLRKKYLG